MKVFLVWLPCKYSREILSKQLYLNSWHQRCWEVAEHGLQLRQCKICEAFLNWGLSEPASKVSDSPQDQGRAAQLLTALISWCFWIISPRMAEFWRTPKKGSFLFVLASIMKRDFVLFWFSFYYLLQEIREDTAVLRRTSAIRMFCFWALHKNINCLTDSFQHFQLIAIFTCYNALYFTLH